jgi:hypothetical protein
MNKRKRKVFDIIESGGAAMTIREIAEQADVSVGTAHRYRNEYDGIGTALGVDGGGESGDTGEDAGEVYIPVQEGPEGLGGAGTGEGEGDGTPEQAGDDSLHFDTVQSIPEPQPDLSDIPEDEYLLKREGVEMQAVSFAAAVNTSRKDLNEAGIKYAGKVKSEFSRTHSAHRLLSGRVDGQAHTLDVVSKRLAEIEEMGGGTMGPVTIVTPDGDTVAEFPEGEHVHAQFEPALKLIILTHLLWAAGNTGTGKTHLASQLAKALNVPLYVYCCTEGMSEGHITGRLGFDNIYLEAAYVKAFEQGGLVLLDEWDAANDNTRLVANSSHSNEYMSVPNRIDNPIAYRHDNFYCMIATNTWGGGGDTAFSGRTSMDLASKDRFMLSKVHVDYDVKLEHSLTSDVLGMIDPKAMKDEPKLFTFPRLWNQYKPATVMQLIRQSIRHNGVDEWAMSTRTLLGMRLLMSNGFTFKQVCEVYFTGWDRDDVRQTLDFVKRGLEECSSEQA